MKEIKLTKGYVTLVDDDDYDYLSQWSWWAHKKDDGTFYAERRYYIGKQQVCVLMHRIIMKTPKGLVVDHIDHNGLNNQKSNLRNCTHKQNMCNRTSFGKSEYLGVYFYKNLWHAQLRHNGKIIKLGSSKIEEEAARKYDIGAKIYHGEFANLNFK